MKTGKQDVSVEFTTADGKTETATFDRLIVSDRPRAEYDWPERRCRGVKLDERTFIVVDGDYRTSAPNVWAVGDVVRSPMLAQGREGRCGGRAHGEASIRMWTSTASRGSSTPRRKCMGRQDRAAAQAEGVAHKAGSFPFLANGRAQSAGQHGWAGQISGRRQD